MDKIDLGELERLAAQATPGPWMANNWGRVWYTSNHDSKRLVCDTMRNTVRNPKSWRANARLIAAMRNSVPDLIAENRALREKVKELEKRNQRLEVRVRNFAYYLENFCRYHGENDGRCPIFYRCPAPALEKSCGDMKRDDWFWDMEQAAKEAGE